MKAVGRWMAVLVAAVAALVALFSLNAWRGTAWLPFNAEGRYFDAEAAVVYTDAGPLFWAVVACAAAALGVGAGILSWKLRRR